MRDLYLTLRRHALAIALVAFGTSLVAFLASTSIPLRYSSETTLSLAPTAGSGTNSVTGPLLLANAPSPAVLAQGFSQEIGAVRALPATSTANHEAVFDEKRNLLVLRATAASPEQAWAEAGQLAKAAQDFISARLLSVATSNLQSALSNARMELANTRRSLDAFQEVLKGTPRTSAPASTASSAALEALKVDPQVARSSDPVRIYLGLQEAQLATQQALAQARVATLEEVAREPEALVRALGQSREIRASGPPSLPLRANPRHILRNTVSGGVVGLVFGMAVVFLLESVWARDKAA